MVIPGARASLTEGTVKCLQVFKECPLCQPGNSGRACFLEEVTSEQGLDNE